MTTSARSWGWRLGIASWLAMGGASATSLNCAHAQITPDGTLGAESSVVTPPTNIDGLPTEQIDGGATRGANLFHSFEQFSVPTGGAAYFNNPPDIQNIISRVTGASISNIDGLIRANGTANLFLLNPNGIIFGPNARLNIGGSFVATTANAIEFGFQGFFSASAPDVPSALTANPSAFFLNQIATGSIENRSYAEAGVDLNGNTINGLRVPDGRSLLLLGGDVRLDGGRLNALGGRVELGGVAESGTVGLNVDGNNLRLDFPDGVARADISLYGFDAVDPVMRAVDAVDAVDVFGEDSGSAVFYARNLQISSGIRAGRIDFSSGSRQAGNITLNATGDISLTSARLNADGRSGAIKIQTGSISLSDSTLSANNFAGVAGTISVLADDSISVANSGIVSVAGFGESSGSINIQARSISVTDESVVNVAATKGVAGNINISASDSVSISGGSKVLASGGASYLEFLSSGIGGNINIRARSVTLSDGASVSATLGGEGVAGNISVQADDSVTFAGSDTSISTSVESEAKGKGGDIRIQARSLSVTGGAKLLAQTLGEGNAGNIQVNASDFVEISGVAASSSLPVDVLLNIVFEDLLDLRHLLDTLDTTDRLVGPSSGLFTTTEAGASGQGGEISVTTGNLRVSDRAVLSARSRSAFRGGNITVNANVLKVTDGGQLLTTAFSSGDAGNITVNVTDRITISGSDPTFRDQFNYVVELFGEEQAESLIDRVDPASGIFASTSASGQGGNITIEGGSIQLRNNSLISTEASSNGNGGNITINADTLIGLGNSDIVANANSGLGGFIQITAQGIFGLERRSVLTPLSDITAFSQQNPDLNGVVEINTPDIDPSQGLATLPVDLVDASGLIVQTCPTGGGQGQSKFIITGRGGLPPNPSDTLSSDAVWTDLGPMTQLAEARPSSEEATQLTNSTPEQLLEAQGWVINNKGEIVLTAQAPSGTPHIPWLTPATCQTPEKTS